METTGGRAGGEAFERIEPVSWKDIFLNERIRAGGLALLHDTVEQSERARRHELFYFVEEIFDPVPADVAHHADGDDSIPRLGGIELEIVQHTNFDRKQMFRRI